MERVRISIVIPKMDILKEIMPEFSSIAEHTCSDIDKIIWGEDGCNDKSD